MDDDEFDGDLGEDDEELPPDEKQTMKQTMREQKKPFGVPINQLIK